MLFISNKCVELIAKWNSIHARNSHNQVYTFSVHWSLHIKCPMQVSSNLHFNCLFEVSTESFNKAGSLNVYTCVPSLKDHGMDHGINFHLNCPLKVCTNNVQSKFPLRVLG